MGQATSARATAYGSACEFTVPATNGPSLQVSCLTQKRTPEPMSRGVAYAPDIARCLSHRRWASPCVFRIGARRLLAPHIPAMRPRQMARPGSSH
jgi:hypothetical protein